MNISKPVRFISVGNTPPEFELDKAPVSGDLVTTM